MPRCFQAVYRVKLVTIIDRYEIKREKSFNLAASYKCNLVKFTNNQIQCRSF